MIFIFVLITLAITFLWSWIYFMKDRRSIAFTGPMPLPIVGNGHMFMGDSSIFIKVLGKLASEHNGAALFYILSERQLVFSHPKYIDAIVSSTDIITKSNVYRYFHPWLGNGLLTSTGDRWKLHRKFLTPAFHFNILRNIIPIFHKNTKILIERLGELADDTPINLFPIIALAALDNVTESVMGVSVNAQKEKESKYVKAIDNINRIISKRIRNPIAATDFLFNFMSDKKTHDEALEILHEHSNKVISTRRQKLKEINSDKLKLDNNNTGMKNRFAFLDLLILSEIDGNKIDNKSIREEVDTFMFEGHDTTTSATVYALYCISQHFDVQNKILEEQRTILDDDDKDPDFNDISKMKYLELVIKESLRLYPAVFLIGRETERDTELAGVRIPKNTSILLDIFHLHRRPDLFENPLEFRPERFEKNTRNPFDWLAFSAGPRNCIGQKFAMLELKVMISAVVRNFHILPAYIEPIPCADVVLRSLNGVNVKLKRRVKSS